ncbi:hypothetical protein [Niabella soli]|uniref:Uroporphyrinogen decarboxylase n=1 Tax=Niabella soli DSM 19437 TaxID=929713 RepID=W0EY72_9BACT|nr:hypothetical protein [Niabella soli]AHF14523.1 uroporphyrinogen decarboxylase [Niabella soli DSM 19437]
MISTSECVGYLAMALLVVSFVPKQLKTVRIINLASCFFFVAYGILLGWAWPIIISNGLVGSIQLYHLLLKKTS